MSFAEFSSWIFVILSLLGNFYVIRKNVIGQWLWTISNIGWISYHFYEGNYSSAFLFSVYFVMSVYGVISWTKEAKAAQQGA